MPKLKICLLVGAATASALACQPALAADTAADTGGFDGIQDIVVTARKRSESLQSVPVAISAFTPEALEKQRIVQVNDLVQHTSGLTIQMGSNPQQFDATIRGQNTLDGAINLDAAIGFYVDGVYLGPPLGNAVALNFDDASSVEVLKGPQGTLYGRNTSGGAIKLDHAEPGYELSGWLKGEVGNYSLRTVKGAVTIPLVDQKASLRVYGRYTKRAGYGRNITTNEDVNDNRAHSLAATLHLDPTDSLHIVARGFYDKDHSGGAAYRATAILPTTNLATIAVAITQNIPNAFQADGSLTPAAIAQAVAAWNAQTPSNFYDMASRFSTPNAVRNYGGSVNATFDITDTLQLKSITGLRWLDTTRNTNFSGSSAASLIPVSQYLNHRQFSEELNLNGTLFSDKLKYTLGAFYLKSKARDVSSPATVPIFGAFFGAASPIPTGIGRQDAEGDTRSYAAYGQATYEITPGLNFTGGLRYTKEHKDLTAHNQYQLGTYNPVNGYVDLFPPVLNQTVFCQEPVQGLGDACSAFQPYSFSKVTWLGSVDYKVTPDVLVYAKVSRGFRSGGGQLRLGGVGFPPFGPETVDDYEAGIKADLFDRHARINIAAFHDSYKQLQRTLLAVVNNSITSAVQNAGKARINGVEFDLQVSPINGLTFGWAGAYTDAKYLNYADPVSGADLSQQKFQNVPKFTWNLSADYTTPTSLGTVSANVSYWHTSDVPLQPGAGTATNGGPSNTNPWSTQQAYGLLSSRVSLELDNGLSVAVWGKNLTAKKYFTYTLDLTASVGNAVSWGGVPRTWGLEVGYKF